MSAKDAFTGVARSMALMAIVLFFAWPLYRDGQIGPGLPWLCIGGLALGFVGLMVIAVGDHLQQKQDKP